jgi:aldehyde dehydrogenase (NAD+)
MASLSGSLGEPTSRRGLGILIALLSDADLVESIACLRYYAGWADKLVGQVRLVIFKVLGAITRRKTVANNTPAKFNFTRVEPIGACGQMYVFGFTTPVE